MHSPPESHIMESKIPANGEINTIDINKLIDSRVQEKVQELLGPILSQLVERARTNLNDSSSDALRESSKISQQPKNLDNRLSNGTQSGGIQFVARNELTQDKLLSWSDPRQPQLLDEETNAQDWLIVTKVIDGESVDYKISIVDRSLRDLIKTCLSSFIAHRGETVWQRAKVDLDSEIDTLVLNYKILEAELERRPPDQTRNRLRELLDIVRAIYDPPVFMCIEDDIQKDFRVETKFLWPLFCPGKLMVAEMHGFDSPQLLRIDRFDLATEGQETTFEVYAWMWDWDGQKLVRSMYEFRKLTPEQSRSNPKEWDFYPVELYEGSDGSRGLSAFREDHLLRNRRRLFIEYTSEYAARYRGANVLRYSGDAYSDQTAFPSGSSGQMDLIIKIFDRDKRSRSKLIKLHEDIVLDTKNYCRRVGEGRKLSVWKEADSKFCDCSMCMDPSTKIWYQKMNAISKAKGARLDTAVNEAVDMAFDDNDLLLPPRVFGFALNKKEWCQFSLDKMQRSQTLKFKLEGSEVEGLIFPPKVMEEERRDIFKLISAHKRVASHHRRLGDTIAGKGESLIFLFHGHSGTGKTLYAESLAKACHLGLFKVGTNDIGLDVEHAERRLKEIFELAENWNTILLIDEADVLLDTRGKENESLVSKNALVSVLLREVEYFKGILIMTTNRVRAFDPAILSRIHHAVDFEESTQQQEMALWNLWYDRMEKEKACVDGPAIKDWMKNTNRKKKRNYLSGREIRNVFLTAQVLAEDERKGINIGLDELERAYHYKDNFLAETEGKINEAKAMVMSGMKQ